MTADSTPLPSIPGRISHPEGEREDRAIVILPLLSQHHDPADDLVASLTKRELHAGLAFELLSGMSVAERAFKIGGLHRFSD